VAAAKPGGLPDALKAVEATLAEALPTADERLRLARLYEAAGDGAKACEQLRSLVVEDELNPEYLSFYIDALLRRGPADEARPWVERLDALEPGSARVKAFRAAPPAPPQP
jgi:hypothetical protein